jgi:hypothetical protein
MNKSTTVKMLLSVLTVLGVLVILTGQSKAVYDPLISACFYNANNGYESVPGIIVPSFDSSNCSESSMISNWSAIDPSMAEPGSCSLVTDPNTGNWVVFIPTSQNSNITSLYTTSSWYPKPPASSCAKQASIGAGTFWDTIEIVQVPQYVDGQLQLIYYWNNHWWKIQPIPGCITCGNPNQCCPAVYTF